MPITYRRLEKATHADTVLYEIDQLRFTAQRLFREQWEDHGDAWVYLESFLVHYRNLIEFLGRPNPRADDVHITNAITGKRLPRWTSSLFRRSPSACSIAFSSSVTTVGVSCTSISQSIRQARGSCSSCEKHFHLDPLRGSSSLIVMPSMDWTSPQRFDP